MARSARNRSSADDDDDLGRRPRGGQQSAASVLIAATALVGLIVGAIVLARSISDKEESAAAASVEEKPQQEKKYFTSVPDEAPPASTGHAGPSALPRAPSGLAASNPDWAKALELARVADELFAEAQKAKQSDDHAEFQLKGKAAKESYDKAIEMTAVWEEELLAQYGDRDPQVREIQSIRTRWTDRLRVLHKTTSR